MKYPFSFCVSGDLHKFALILRVTSYIIVCIFGEAKVYMEESQALKQSVKKQPLPAKMADIGDPTNTLREPITYILYVPNTSKNPGFNPI